MNYFRVENEDIKGIPDFWLTIFKNVETLADMVQEHDEAILKHLYDIRVIFLDNPMVSWKKYISFNCYKIKRFYIIYIIRYKYKSYIVKNNNK